LIRGPARAACSLARKTVKLPDSSWIQNSPARFIAGWIIFCCNEKRRRRHHGREFFAALKTAAAVLAGATLAITCATAHAQDKPIRIGLVTFLSGPASRTFGVPAKMAADAIVDSLNAGKAPAPYNIKGSAEPHWN